MYLLMYLSALFFCLLPTYLKNKDNQYYRSLGASGGRIGCDIRFHFLAPLENLGLIILPGISIPGFIFGALYLVISICT